MEDEKSRENIKLLVPPFCPLQYASLGIVRFLKLIRSEGR